MPKVKKLAYKIDDLKETLKEEKEFYALKIINAKELNLDEITEF